MITTEELKSRHERNARAMALRPARGQGTATTTARLRPGSLACEISDGPWSLVVDVSRDEGGEGEGPDPGVLARAALGACMAIAYRTWAARAGVTLGRVEVAVEADYDARGAYGVDGAGPPGWAALRVRAEIEGDAGEAQLREIVALADRHSPILDDFARALPVTHDVTVVSREGD
jgi:uncharacterized OsmC-like protein